MTGARAAPRAPASGAGAEPVRTACYVHTPFCVVKCGYCNFASHVRGSGEGSLYLAGLAAELDWHARHGRLAGRLFDTLFLGGGTPSALEAGETRALFSLLRRRLRLDSAAEITAEANPESLTGERALLWRDLGVNRISIGVQSLDDDELRLLDRPHDAAAARRAVAAARSAGFDNLSLDLIYGLPGQGLAHWQSTVEQAVDLGPDHLSCYCLIVEPGTPLAREVAGGRLPAPDTDLQREMFDWLTARLEASGYRLYEISNFARPGRCSEHNLRYWRGRPFLGLGPSAHSYLDGRRAANPATLDHYHRRFTAPDPEETFREVPVRDLVFERVFMALRLAEGLSLSEFEAEFGRPLAAYYPGLVDRLVRTGALIQEVDRLRLAPHLWFVSDAVFAEFAA